MPSLRSLPLMVFVSLCACAFVARASEFTLFRSVWGSVVVATDYTEAGRKLPTPTPQQPVYYKGRSLGCRLGSIRGDREPDTKQMDQFVAGILAKQGYVGAPASALDPDLFLVVQWGYVRPGSEDLLWFLGYNPADDIAAPASPISLGPEVWRRGMRSNLVETILQDSEDPIYGVIVTAFDPKTVTSREPVIYWQTRIGLPANGKSMADALPVMLKAAGPVIGRPADKPVMLDADRVREGQVKFGDLKVIEYQTPAPGPAEVKDGRN